LQTGANTSRKYFIGVVLAILVLAGNQLFIQYWLAQKRNDSKTINLAGKQRMLSQRINLECFRFSNQTGSIDSLKTWYSEWAATHEALIQGGDGLNPVKDNIAQPLMLEMSGLIQDLGKKINSAPSFTSQELKAITQTQGNFLHKMDRVVNILEAEYSRKLRFIVVTEIFLMLLSLIITTLEVIYIYMPISKNLSDSLEEIKEKHQELTASHEKVKLKNEELEQFVSNVAHDLKEPLRTVSIQSSMLEVRNKHQLDEKGRRSLSFIQSSIRRMQSHVEALLAHSRIGRKYKPQKLDTDHIIEEVITDLQVANLESGALIQMGDLPTIFGSAPEIRMLFQNLIMNAIKFQPNGQQPVIQITGSTKPNHWLFTIADNGIGISDSQSDKILDIFRRGHAKDEFEGHGIGLAHCRKIVALHGGNIWVNSKVGEGSKFYFTIQRPENETAIFEEDLANFSGSVS